MFNRHHAHPNSFGARRVVPGHSGYPLLRRPSSQPAHSSSQRRSPMAPSVQLARAHRPHRANLPRQSSHHPACAGHEAIRAARCTPRRCVHASSPLRLSAFVRDRRQRPPGDRLSWRCLHVPGLRGGWSTPHSDSDLRHRLYHPLIVSLSTYTPRHDHTQ